MPLIPNMRPARTLEELERNIQSMEIFHAVCVKVRDERAKVLARPIPRNECPGCFSAIHDGAAKLGWCLDCHPNRTFYSANELDPGVVRA